MKRIDKGIGLIESGICITTIVIISIIATIQIILRYFFAKSIPWGEEVMQMLMVWMVFFGAARATRKNAHTEMDGAVMACPKVLRIAIIIFTCFVTLGYLVVLFISSAQLTMKATVAKSIMLRLPMKYMYMSMPIGGAFMVYEFVKTILPRIKKGLDK